MMITVVFAGGQRKCIAANGTLPLKVQGAFTERQSNFLYANVCIPRFVNSH